MLRMMCKYIRINALSFHPPYVAQRISCATKLSVSHSFSLISNNSGTDLYIRRRIYIMLFCYIPPCIRYIASLVSRKKYVKVHQVRGLAGVQKNFFFQAFRAFIAQIAISGMIRRQLRFLRGSRIRALSFLRTDRISFEKIICPIRRFFSLTVREIRIYPYRISECVYRHIIVPVEISLCDKIPRDIW